jgi:hypothetical protein
MADDDTSPPASPAPDGAGPTGLSRRTFLRAAGLAGAGLALDGVTPAEAGAVGVTRRRPAGRARRGVVAGPAGSEFEVEYEAGALVSLRRRDDAYDTDYVAEDQRLGHVLLRWRRPGGGWQEASTAALAADGAMGAPRVRERAGVQTYETVFTVRDERGPVLALTVGFDVGVPDIHWRIGVENRTPGTLEIGDLAIPLPVTTRYAAGEGQRSTARVLKHQLIAGDGSFFFWIRSNSVGPFLVLVPDQDTHLEYWESQGGFRAFLHSGVAGEEARARGTRWRQPHTTVTLAPASSATRGFRLRWADGYDAVRDVLVEEGLVDVQVVPGMTVPSDLFARFSLRTREPVHAVEAEYPDSTEIRAVGRRGDAEIYEVRFARLGENRLTVRFGQDRHMVLEWFCTEPVETLIRKRARFIADKRHTDPGLWYRGLLAEWNMETHTLLGPDNYDRIRGWRIYAATCDDPGLSKPAFLAAKNAVHPDPAEVAVLDEYLDGFVWGGLQRSTDETFPYGIYGIPDWKQNRESPDPGRNGRMHIWRIYDYPHVFLTYYGLYRVAREHPEIPTALSAETYLRRAYETAVAMFTIPYEVERWSAYGTGLYNELVIVDLLDALEREGWRDELDRLRLHWERKVQQFINGGTNLFQSEYSFDSTGFETTHALAKYALDHRDRLALERPANDRFPPIHADASLAFLETQLAANLFCRGWIETAYYYLGSDYRGGAGERYTLTYMSQMGGWAVLDYALRFATDPFPLLRLGYASALSSWALMNTGTPASDYGYWYPGAENDGGAGGGFEPSPFGQTWLEQPHTRGSWYYACEIDLGFCGGLRAAATILADDPLFDRFCFGGDWRRRGNAVEVVPKDGVRRRFHAILEDGRLHLECDTDRFAAGRPISLAAGLAAVDFTLESDNRRAHTARVRVGGLEPGAWAAAAGRRRVATFQIEEGRDTTVELPMNGGTRPTAFRLTRLHA